MGQCVPSFLHDTPHTPARWSRPYTTHSPPPPYPRPVESSSHYSPPPLESSLHSPPSPVQWNCPYTTSPSPRQVPTLLTRPVVWTPHYSPVSGMDPTLLTRQWYGPHTTHPSVLWTPHYSPVQWYGPHTTHPSVVWTPHYSPVSGMDPTLLTRQWYGPHTTHPSVVWTPHYSPVSGMDPTLLTPSESVAETLRTLRPCARDSGMVLV